MYLYFYGNALKIKFYADGSGFKVESDVLAKYFKENENQEKYIHLKGKVESILREVALKEIDSLIDMLPQIQEIYKEEKCYNERSIECYLMKKNSSNSDLILLDMEVVVENGKEFNTDQTSVSNREGDIIAVVKGKSQYRFLPIELKRFEAIDATKGMALDEIKTFMNTIYGCITDKNGLFHEFKMNYEKIFLYKKSLNLINIPVKTIEIMDDTRINPIGLILEIDEKSKIYELVDSKSDNNLKHDKCLIYKLICSSDTFLKADWVKELDI